MLEKELAKLNKIIENEKRLGDKRAKQFYDWLVDVGDGDVKVAVDIHATAGRLGAAFNDGVLRTIAPLTFGDGGDFVTLGFAFLGLQDLTAPGADRILIWDNSAGAFKWLQLGGGISINATPQLKADHNAIDNYAANRHIVEHISDNAPGPGDGNNGDLWFEY